MEEPRDKELIGKTFYGEDGKPFEDIRFHEVPAEEMPTLFISTQYTFLNGKIDGEPAIIYPDGLEETWKNGEFVKVHCLPNKPFDLGHETRFLEKKDFLSQSRLFGEMTKKP